MQLYNELRENWERLYWDEGYSKKLAVDHANYDSPEDDDDEDFSPYRSVYKAYCSHLSVVLYQIETYMSKFLISYLQEQTSVCAATGMGIIDFGNKAKTCLVGLGKRTVYGNTPNERCVLFVMDVSLLTQW